MTDVWEVFPFREKGGAMRAIKFRCWQEGVMVGPFTLKEIMCEEPRTFPWVQTQQEKEAGFDNSIFMQYTGLKDKKGVELFKSDIIRDKGGVVGEICWHDELGAWSWCGGEDWGMIDTHDVEKIGNVYENSDLLKGG